MSECRHCHESHYGISDTVDCLESSLAAARAEIERLRGAANDLLAEIEGCIRINYITDYLSIAARNLREALSKP